MGKKIFFVFLLSIVLTSCVSITEVSESPFSQKDFVTAMLAPTATGWLSATSTALPEGTTPGPVVTAFANCTNAAILLRDVMIPDDTQVKAGETFTKTWEIQNTGTCPWTGYTMKFSAGESMNAPLSAPIADTPPNGNVQVSVELTAPSADGAYTASFTLNDSVGNVIPIGSEKSFWAKIVVGNPVVMLTLPASSIGESANCAYSENAGYVSELISLIDQARVDANLPALTVNTRLTQAAQNHSVDMACSNLLSHFGSDGSGWWDRIARTGYFSAHGASVAEIIAIGTPQDAMHQWRSDPGHWEFIMAVNTQIGVGYAYYSQSDFGGYITVDFGE